jgi:hypothetical protein
LVLHEQAFKPQVIPIVKHSEQSKLCVTCRLSTAPMQLVWCIKSFVRVEEMISKEEKTLAQGGRTERSAEVIDSVE